LRQIKFFIVCSRCYVGARIARLVVRRCALDSHTVHLIVNTIRIFRLAGAQCAPLHAQSPRFLNPSNYQCKGAQCAPAVHSRSLLYKVFE
jgi:hypothetical protein